jgi:hypothetical protein
MNSYFAPGSWQLQAWRHASLGPTLLAISRCILPLADVRAQPHHLHRQVDRSPVYVNSLLAALNMRVHLRRTAVTDVELVPQEESPRSSVRDLCPSTVPI